MSNNEDWSKLPEFEGLSPVYCDEFYLFPHRQINYSEQQIVELLFRLNLSPHQMEVALRELSLMT